jgi:tRNA-splicing ligase RtcB
MERPEKKNLIKISDYIWEIPKSFREDMRVPARIFAEEKMLDDILEDKSLWQLVNVASLPGICKYALGMPDIHEGYGMPVGGVAAFDYDEGIISPGICGYDINCGVRLAITDLNYEEVKDKIPKLTEEIFKQVPSGVGRGGFWKLNNDEMKKVLENGAQYIVELGYGEKEDLEATESFGKLEGADAEVVSKTAKDRGRDQLGTMGAGNHFVEVQRVQEIYEPLMNSDTTLMNADKNIRVNPRENPRLYAAKKLGLEKGKVAILIHCGSRGLGHQVATDYIRQALNYIDKKNIELPDRELAYFPYRHPEGQNYLSAMKASANFAFANRQLILHQVRKAFKKVFGKEIKLKQVYDVAHNIVKIEEYDNRKLIVHRKGATRAFWRGHPELAPNYREIGQPTLIPGSMGTSSYILIGQELAKEISFGSAPHGAGRLMSRAEAKRKIRGSELKKELEKRGISVAAGSMSGLAEEAPAAYKDVSEVVEVVHNIGIAKKLAKLLPVGVIKG